MRQKKKVSRRAGSFPAEFRIRVVKLFLEEGYSAGMIAEEFFAITERMGALSGSRSF